MKEGEFGPSSEAWDLHYPEGTQICNSDGGEASSWCYGIAKMAQYITGTNFQDIHTANDWQYAALSTGAGTAPYPNAHQDVRLAMTCGAVCDDWGSNTQQNISNQGQYEGFGCDLFYGLLNRYLNPSHSLLDDPGIDNCAISDMLTSAPLTGPCCFPSGNSFTGPPGWASSYRFYADSPQQNGSGFTGNFNGLDYMLLHNMYYLAQNSGTQPILYGTYPIISSTGDLGSTAKPLIYGPNTDQAILVNTLHLEQVWDPANLQFMIGDVTVVGDSKGIDITNLSVTNSSYFHAYCEPTSPCVPDPTQFSSHRSINKPGDGQNSTSTYIPTHEFKALSPHDDALGNYPNPVVNQTTFNFYLNSSQVCTLRIFDLSGREVVTLFQDKQYDIGEYTIPFDLSGLTAGSYFYMLNEGNQKFMRKLIKVKR